MMMATVFWMVTTLRHLDPTVSVDTDGDGISDNVDTDDDGDGVPGHGRRISA